MGQFPCPRCEIQRDKIREFATPDDMEIRRTQARCDDEDRQKKVEKACEFIYEKGYVVSSSHVEDLLKEESLVPTEACLFSFYIFIFVNVFSECFFIPFVSIWFRLPSLTCR